MLKKIFQHGVALHKEFLKYFITGATAFILDIGSLYLLGRFTTLPYYLAVLINQPPVLLYIFLLNKHWSFCAKGLTHRQMIRFVSVAIFNYLVAGAWMWLFTEGWPLHIVNKHVDYLIVRLANVVVSVLWNFLLYKYWVYKKEAGEAI